MDRMPSPAAEDDLRTAKQAKVDLIDLVHRYYPPTNPLSNCSAPTAACDQKQIPAVKPSSKLPCGCTCSM